MPLRKIDELMQAKAYEQARREANRLLIQGELTPREQGIALRAACRACLYLEEYFAAAKLGELAMEKGRAIGDPDTTGRAALLVGYAYMNIGDTYVAQHNFETFLNLYPEMLGAEEWEGTAYLNLAVVQRQRKEWAAAIQSLERAADLFERNGQIRERALTDLDLAWCYLMQNQPSPAKPYLDSLEAYLVDHRDGQLSADHTCGRALYSRLVGDLATSSRLCQEIFVPDQPGVTSHQMGEAAWILGENALDLGRMEDAMLFANIALDHAIRDAWPSFMNLAVDLRRRIATRAATGA